MTQITLIVKYKPLSHKPRTRWTSAQSAKKGENFIHFNHKLVPEEIEIVYQQEVISFFNLCFKEKKG